MLAVAVHQRWLRACRCVWSASYPILPAVALCDGRRWEMNGVLKNTLLNQYFVWLYVACRALTKRDGHSSHAWLREQIHKPWVHPRPDLQHVLRQQDQAGRNPATNGPPINRVALVTGTASSAGVVERNSAIAKQQCMPVGRGTKQSFKHRIVGWLYTPATKTCPSHTALRRTASKQLPERLLASAWLGRGTGRRVPHTCTHAQH